MKTTTKFNHIPRRIIAAFLAIIVMFSCSATAFAAEEPLDEILKYRIEIDMLDNGNAEITYTFDWKVLDSDSEGPLEYLFVGIPNRHVEEYTPLTDNIKSLEYSSTSDRGSGHFVRIDFHRKYYKDEVFTFSFKINQGYLYTLNDDDTVTFGFTPGWFDNIAIDDLTVLWNGNYIVSSDCHSTDENNRLVWQTSLEAGESEKLSCEVIYQQNRFTELSPDRQAANASDGELGAIGVIFIIFLIILVIMVIIAIADDGYGGGGGYRSGGVFISSCARSSCARSSCACACACAGGGRAGCSAKNIYGVDTVQLNRVVTNYKMNLKIKK